MVLILNWIVRMSKISIFKVDTETLGGNNMELDKILDYLDCRAKEVKKIDYEIGDIYKFLFSKCLTETIKKHCQIINKDIFGIETYKKYVDYESERLKGLWQVGYFLKYKGKKVTFHLDLRTTMTIHPALNIYVMEKDMTLASELLGKITEEIHSLKKTMFTGTGRMFNLERKYDFDEIILPENIKQVIKEQVIDFFDKEDLFLKHDIPFKRGLILHGNPGNGKTLLCKILASNLNCNFIWVPSADVAFSYDISNIYMLARMIRPCIVLMEDIDLLGFEGRESRASREILGELLNQMDGFHSNSGLITIGTTNNCESLDKAISNRPGRFDIKLPFNDPDFEMRKKLIKKFTEKMEIAKDVDLEDIIKRADKLSCSGVKELINKSLIFSCEELKKESKQKVILTKTSFKRAIISMELQKKQIGFLSIPKEKAS